MTNPPAPLAEAEEPGIVNPKDPSSFLERHSGIFFLIIAVLFLFIVIVESQNKLMWHDELFTYYIAQAPNLSTLIHQTRTVDLNPPLSYLLVRGLFHLFPPNATVIRIPSMAGFVLCMWCVYSFVARKISTAWGVVGIVLLATGTAYTYAFEARPYGLMLGFLALAFVGWQRATDEKEEKRLLGLCLLVCGGLGALLSHVFALFAWMMLILAELVRVRMSRRPDWNVLLALLLPLSAVVTYIPLIRTHAISYFPSNFQPNQQKVIGYYILNFGQPVFSVVYVMIFTMVFVKRRTFKPQGKLPVNTPELLALFGFLTVPAILMLYLMHVHAAFFLRYGIVANFAIAVLLPVFSGWFAQGSRAVAWLTALVLILWSPLPSAIVTYALHPSRLSLSIRKPGTCEACELANRLAAELPFVDASGLTFMEMDNREDVRFLSRVYYLTDPSASIRYAHANIFEGMQSLKDAFHIRANVEPYSIFVRQHPTFLVLGDYDYPEDWLLKKLKADGAHMCLLRTVSDPQFKDKQLWHVTFDPAQTNGCAS